MPKPKRKTKPIVLYQGDQPELFDTGFYVLTVKNDIGVDMNPEHQDKTGKNKKRERVPDPVWLGKEPVTDPSRLNFKRPKPAIAKAGKGLTYEQWLKL